MPFGVTFSNLVSYPIEYIDPCSENAKRDDGEEFIKRFRMLWKILEESKESISIFKYVLGTNIASTNQAALLLIKKSLMDPSSRIKPMARLISSQTNRFCAEVMDKFQHDFIRNSIMVAIKGQTDSAEIGYQNQCLSKPVAIFRFEKKKFEPHISGIDSDSQIEVSAVPATDASSGHTIKISVASFSGMRKQFSIKCKNSELYSKLFSNKHLLYPDERLLLPYAPNQLPIDMQMRFAEFWKTQMYADVLIEACQPNTNMSKRSLCFDSVSLHSIGKSTGYERTLLRGTLHDSSSSCICCSHGMQPMQTACTNQRIVDSKVNLNFTMCGRALIKPSPLMEFGICPLHGNETPKVPGVTDFCCFGTACEVTCSHFTDKREFKPGLSIRSIPLDNVQLLEVQIIMASAIRCQEAIAPILGKQNLDDLAVECKVQANKLDIALEQLERHKVAKPVVFSQKKIDALNAKAVQLLREHKVKQQYKKSERRTYLIKPNPKTGGFMSLKGEENELNLYHRWMFPRA